MKIISKFKDYYDGAIALGIDSNLFYKRKTELVGFESLIGYESFIRDRPDTIELERLNIDSQNYHLSTNYVDFNEVVIGFCGKLYPAFEFVTIKDKKEINSSFFYKAEDVVLFFSELEAKYKGLTYGNWYNYKINKPTIKELNVYLKARVFDMDYIEWFQAANCPVFKLTENPNKQQSIYARNTRDLNSKIYIEKNPVLNKLEFYRIIDVYTVFQSLNQFLSGVLTNTEINESTLNDIQKVQQFGFDEKYGFRKRPKIKE